MMKPIKLILTALCCALLLCGCGTAEGAGKGDGSKEDPNANVQAYREAILGLQQELETLRAEQKQQTAAYEAKIDALETLLASISASQTPDGNGATDTSDPTASSYTYSVRDGGAVITSYLGSEAFVRIPDRLGDYPVVAIGEGAFRNSSVVQVILPEGVRVIDWFAFYGSYRLQSVTLPASVTTIEYGAFELCSSALKFTCPSASYAAQYASSYGIPVVND